MLHHITTWYFFISIFNHLVFSSHYHMKTSAAEKKKVVFFPEYEYTSCNIQPFPLTILGH